MPTNVGTLIHRPSASRQDRTLGSSIFDRLASVRAPLWLKFKRFGTVV